MQIALDLLPFVLNRRADIIHHFLVVPNNFVIFGSVLLHLPFLRGEAKRR